MRKSSLIVFFLAIFVFLSLGFSFAEEGVSQPASKTTPEQNPLKEQLNPKQPNSKLTEAAKEPAFEVPDWVERTNVAIEAGTGMKPKYFMETIQPLFGTQEKETVLFNQTRISSQEQRTTYNLGFGARRILRDWLLLGVNTFYDYQDLHQHHRAGVGFEAINDKGLEARLNTYMRVSSQRLVSEDAGGQNFEKVANGFDWEVGTPLPYMPYLKIYGGGNWYSFERFHNKYGWNMRLEYTPIKYSRLDFIMVDDNKRNDISYRFEGAITLAFTSFHPRDIINDLFAAKEAFPKVNLEDKVLDRVVRDFDITTINYTKTWGGLTVEGGKT